LAIGGLTISGPDGEEGGGGGFPYQKSLINCHTQAIIAKGTSKKLIKVVTYQYKIYVFKAQAKRLGSKTPLKR
jgi:hypothetical protein